MVVLEWDRRKDRAGVRGAASTVTNPLSNVPASCRMDFIGLKVCQLPGRPMSMIMGARARACDVSLAAKRTDPSLRDHQVDVRCRQKRALGSRLNRRFPKQDSRSIQSLEVSRSRE